MTFIRLYTGDDGNTHIEELDPNRSPRLTEQMAQSISFRVTEAGHFLDWHPAPRRQFVINLAGEFEIGLRDGTVHRCGPGDVVLAEDVTGSGHTRRVVGNTPRISATVSLA